MLRFSGMEPAKDVKRELPKHGFRIIEDDYTSRRGGKFDSVHNMLAIRGEPAVCLAAHTDVCRDHGWKLNIPDVDPVVKYIETANGKRKIIQDRNCNIQVGGDDRLGVAINVWIATHTEYDLGLFFPTDEEIGIVSSSYCDMQELIDFDIMLQTDRGNHSNQLVTSIGGVRLCSEETGNMLIDISRELGYPRDKVQGLLTDVYGLIKDGKCKEAVNMTVGYHNSYGSDPTEFIDVVEAEECLSYVQTIVEHYEQNKVGKLAEAVKSETKIEHCNVANDGCEKQSCFCHCSWCRELKGATA